MATRLISPARRESADERLQTLPRLERASKLVARAGRVLIDQFDQLRAQGVPVKDKDVARLSPLGHARLNCLGRYAIASSSPERGLRPPGPTPPPEDDSVAVVDEDGV
ncbi:hypothetical protein AB0395_33925 [Streptosporangium sp. NPDC051023]|uniref:hypothetical protein n=1 Tax=Streptosporangium sp. NPDC051023 TaxID=3155410 RepID=UPI00344B9BF2